MIMAESTTTALYNPRTLGIDGAGIRLNVPCGHYNARTLKIDMDQNAQDGGPFDGRLVNVVVD